MTVILRTMFPQTVLWCLKEMGFEAPTRTEEEGAKLSMIFPGDKHYREMAVWLGHAMACGLIVRGEIER